MIIGAHSGRCFIVIKNSSAKVHLLSNIKQCHVGICLKYSLIASGERAFRKLNNGYRPTREFIVQMVPDESEHNITCRVSHRHSTRIFSSLFFIGKFSP